jgi:hypothetical protein
LQGKSLTATIPSRTGADERDNAAKETPIVPDESLILMVKEVRGKTLRLLDGVSDDDAGYTPAGLNNTILWHAGHALVVVEQLSVAPATGGGAPTYPQGWFETFGWKSTPATVTQWPSLGEVVGRLRDQQARLISALEQLSDERLAELGQSNRPLRYTILHGLHDEAGHQGEIHLLKKLRRVGVR